MMQPVAIAFLLVVSFVSGQERSQWDESYLLDFNYDLSTDEGPNNWEGVNTDSNEYKQYSSSNPNLNLAIGENECDKESRPSPISLDVNGRCFDQHDIRTRQIKGNDCTRDDITFEITPHVLRAYYPRNNRRCRRPTIWMDHDRNDLFNLVWMELHLRSEHVVDGKRYDAELQMVHMGTQGSNDEMATISVLIDATADEDNEEFQYLLNKWQNVADDEQNRCKNVDSNRELREHVYNQVNANALRKRRNTVLSDFILDQSHRQTQSSQICSEDDATNCGPRKKMYPYSLWPSIWYFRYDGGLTTPPCSSIVNWRIIDKPMRISKRQRKQMAQLSSSYQNEQCNAESVMSPQGENFRPLQSRNRNLQSVSHCTSDHFSETLYRPRFQ